MRGDNRGFDESSVDLMRELSCINERGGWERGEAGGMVYMLERLG